MFDPAVVDACKQCLLGAVANETDEKDIALCARALARDLIDTCDNDADALLDAASREAIADLDESDLEARGFAAALARLARIKAAVEADLAAARAAELRWLPL